MSGKAGAADGGAVAGAVAVSHTMPMTSGAGRVLVEERDLRA